jgi:predicted GIY-YIG superfamily endonuclease
LTEISDGALKWNCGTIFLSHWTHSKVIDNGYERVFADVAVTPVASRPKVYVLELAQNKVYVDVSNNVERSIQEHLEGNGGEFTRKYVTTAVLLPRPSGPSTSSIETIRNMMKYGIVNVRGWKYEMSEVNINEAMADVAAHLRN